jgi:hypothetical protein
MRRTSRAGRPGPDRRSQDIWRARFTSRVLFRALFKGETLLLWREREAFEPAGFFVNRSYFRDAVSPSGFGLTDPNLRSRFCAAGVLAAEVGGQAAGGGSGVERERQFKQQRAAVAVAHGTVHGEIGRMDAWVKGRAGRRGEEERRRRERLIEQAGKDGSKQASKEGRKQASKQANQMQPKATVTRTTGALLAPLFFRLSFRRPCLSPSTPEQATDGPLNPPPAIPDHEGLDDVEEGIAAQPPSYLPPSLPSSLPSFLPVSSFALSTPPPPAAA